MNLGSLIEESVKRFGEYESTYFEGKWYTNGETNRNSNRLGNALRSLGIGKGDGVVVQMPNSPPVFSAFPAIYKIGGVVVPVTPLLRPDQAAYIYRDCGAKAILTSADYLGWIQEAQKHTPNLKHIILTDKDDVPGTISYQKLMADSSDELVMEETDNDDLSALMYTAGTTGHPKGVMHTHFSLYINSLALYEFGLVNRPLTLRQTSRSIDPTTHKPVETEQQVTALNQAGVSLFVLPLSHSYGIALMNAGYLAGGRSVVLKWWNVEEALQAIETFRVTGMAGVPVMYVQILNHPDLDKYDLSSLQDCACGAAPLALEVAHAWKKKTGIDIREGWGMTETAATTSGQPLDRPSKIGSIGRCMIKCNTMRIFDENGREVPQGQTGEIVVKGPTIMKGYWNLPEETAQTLRDGWLYTGDIGYIDEDGYFYITDRKKDIIIRGGENLSPREVEEVLYQHPKVAEAGVIGIPDKTYGEEIKAFVVLKAGEKATEEEIITFCKDYLPTFKRPKIVQFTDALPKNLLGKVLRAELRKLG